MIKKNQSRNAILFVVFMFSSVIGAFAPFNLAQFYWGDPVNKSSIIICSIPFIIITLLILIFYYKSEPSNDKNENGRPFYKWIKDIIAIIFVGLGLGSISLIIVTW